MPIPDYVLNAQLVTTDVHTGVYQSRHRRTAVVVRVKGDMVSYLTLCADCRIELEHVSRTKFIADWPIELFHYPALRAIRKYASYVVKDNFRCTPEARKVINAILVRK